MSRAQSIFERWINEEPLTDAEQTEIDARAHAIFEDMADAHRKGEH